MLPVSRAASTDMGWTIDSRPLARSAEALNASNSHSGQDLWGLIQRDLDWQATNWAQAGCDLWEEIRSDDFFWRHDLRNRLGGQE